MEEGEEGGRLYTYRYTVTTRTTPALRQGHFNVSLIVKNKVTRQYPQNTTFFEEKGKPKRNLLISLTALPLGQTGSLLLPNYL